MNRRSFVKRALAFLAIPIVAKEASVFPQTASVADIKKMAHPPSFPCSTQLLPDAEFDLEAVIRGDFAESFDRAVAKISVHGDGGFLVPSHIADAIEGKIFGNDVIRTRKVS
ncbi:hypothetical protein LCGC14_1025100 [marine sediment metagenome]|uniref:Uncharacterized protein n=1 Tax=marine sediment metagenome TaxID=412755 RepID=A0A0F9MWA9_9ZZZZ